MNVKNGLVKQEVKQMSVTAAMNQFLDRDGLRRRFDELLGRRAPQFVSSIVTLVNSDSKLMAVFQNDPMQIIQSALKAASYDLPIDPGLGYAYIIPFNRKGGSPTANFIIGYKGQVQLALRTGLYVRINTIEVREGELVSYDMLTDDITFDWIQDPIKRSQTPVIGYAAYYRLKSGMEKTLYMTKAEVEAHERANRKGSYQSPVWKERFDDMARKTVLRRLLSKWGIMSINYLDASPQDQRVMEAMAKGTLDDDDTPPDAVTIDNAVPENRGDPAPVAAPEQDEIPFPGDTYVDPATGEVRQA